MSIVTVQNLTKIFSPGFWPFGRSKPYTAVNNISFAVKKGEILGLLGPNGAGKTTTIQMLLGTLEPTSGTISYFENNFTENPIACLQKIGSASGYDKLPGRLTVRENLEVAGLIYGLSSAARRTQIEKMLHFFSLESLRNRQTGTLSAGQATRVMLAKAFLADPQLVLLDEPTAALDPDIAHEVRHFILTQTAQHNTAILITSHNMDEVTQLCDRVLILKQGTIIADNTPEQLARSIANIHVHLTITHNLPEALAYVSSQKLVHTVEKNEIIIELDEHNIAQFLSNLAAQQIIYSQISIDKPTLEDYFLSVAKNGTQRN